MGRETTRTNKNPILSTETPPRVDPNKTPPPNDIPVSTLQYYSKQLKNARFRNTVQHRYPLCSKTPTSPSNFRKSANKHGTNFKMYAAQSLFAQHTFQHHARHMFCLNRTKESIDSVLKISAKHTWGEIPSNKWGQLAQGNIHEVRFTDTIDFIYSHEIQPDKKFKFATYALDFRPLKEEQNRVWITVDGDRLTYLDDAGSPEANLLETKVLINSTISDSKHGARFMSADIKDYFFTTPMGKVEFVKV